MSRDAAFLRHLLNVADKAHELPDRTKAWFAFREVYLGPNDLETMAGSYVEAQGGCSCKLCRLRWEKGSVEITVEDYKKWRTSREGE